MLRPHSVLALLIAAAASGATPTEVAAVGVELGFSALLQADGYRTDDDLSEIPDETGFRRAELVARATHTSGVEAQIGYDVHSDKWLDLSVRGKLTGATSWRLGQFKQPNSLEELGSTRHNDFVSKSMVTNTFGVARRLGAEISGAGPRWSASGSWFGRELTQGLARGAGFGVRGTWSPWSDTNPGSTRFLHLGLSVIDHDTSGDTLRLRARPAVDLSALRLIDSGSLRDADRIRTTGLEAAWARGSMLLQGEHYRARVARNAESDFNAGGWYAQAIWTIGGRHTYRNGVVGLSAANDPRRGIWQLGLRYDTLDLDDGPVRGGRARHLTAGVNWYWRDQMKLMLNLVQVQSERRRSEDDPFVVALRAQWSY